ncbi:hypothetical protein [Nakamurella endophytica]|uniref:Uncharacterized protein n=1 Tax=Nakamurella endophytica TaxID=1748367 RepID=A0A917TAH8_9ACTN|nr:hypothetical protein [Nakamurella endophytica]GGM16360.1 hypothetical protein GCM10011594_40570 [Nakamurella endophytica]
MQLQLPSPAFDTTPHEDRRPVARWRPPRPIPPLASLSVAAAVVYVGLLAVVGIGLLATRDELSRRGQEAADTVLLLSGATALLYVVGVVLLVRRTSPVPLIVLGVLDVVVRLWSADGPLTGRDVLLLLLIAAIPGPLLSPSVRGYFDGSTTVAGRS